MGDDHDPLRPGAGGTSTAEPAIEPLDQPPRGPVEAPEQVAAPLVELAEEPRHETLEAPLEEAQLEGPLAVPVDEPVEEAIDLELDDDYDSAGPEILDGPAAVAGGPATAEEAHSGSRFNVIRSTIEGDLTQVNEAHARRLDVTAGSVAIAQMSADHAQIKVEGFQPETPFTFEVDPELLRRVAAVFVPPAGLDPAREASLLRSEARIFVVYGERLTGKLTTCLHLSLALQEREPSLRICFYRHPRGTAVPFVHHAQTGGLRATAGRGWESALATSTVFIPELPLEEEVAGIDDWELSLAGILASRGSYVVLRSERPFEPRADRPAQAIDAHVADLEAVFAHHLDYYLRPRSGGTPGDLPPGIHQRWAEVADLVHFPAEVDTFCLRLSAGEPTPSRGELRRAAEEAVRHHRDESAEARAWFRGLGSPEPLNLRLFALLLGLFEGLPTDVVEEIYVKSVASLREEAGLKELRDPRVTSFGELLELVGAREQELVVAEGQAADEEIVAVFYGKRSYGQEALRQLSYHRPMLRSLAQPFIELIELYSGREHWRIRRTVAEALGRIGAWHSTELFAIVDRLARSERPGVRVVAGNVLGQAVGDNPQALRHRKLNAWIESGHPDQMFLAGAALWRVFESSARATADRSSADVKGEQELFRLVRKLIDRSGRFGGNARALAVRFAGRSSRDPGEAEHARQELLRSWHRRNIESAALALQMMARVDAAAVVLHLKEWSGEESRDASLRRALDIAMQQIFVHEWNEGGMPPLPRVEVLLELVPLILGAPAEHRRAVAPMMRTLAAWSETADGRERVSRTLLDLANTAARQTGGALRLAIAEHWLEETSAEVQRLGGVLIARSVATEGFPCELPGASRCLLVVDTTAAALDAQAPRLAAWLEQLVGALVDVEVVTLSSTAPAEPAAAGAARLSGVVPRAQPRLVMPLLEQRRAAEVSSVLVLAWGPLLDLDDARESSWGGRLLVVNAGSRGRGARRGDGTAVELYGTDLGEIELHLNLLRARQLAAMPADRWRGQLRRELLDPPNHRALEAALRARVLAFGDLSSIESSSETRLVLSAVLWLALEDLGACCELIERWLEEGTTTPGCSLLAVMGQASASMLFRLFACADPLPNAATHARLFALAGPLVDRGWSGVGVVLFAIRRWLEDESWRAALLDDAQRLPLHGWLQKVAARYHRELAASVEVWRAPLDPAIFTCTGETPTAVVALADEMSVAVDAARSAVAPPPLVDGRCYALLVVGADRRRERLRRRLADLAAAVAVQGHERLGAPVWLLYRCGRARPRLIVERVDEASGDHFVERLFAADEAQRPPLLAPLLETQRPAEVGFVLILATEPLLDEADLAAGPWPRLLHRYVVPEPAAGRPAREDAAAVDEAARRLVLELAHLRSAAAAGGDLTP